MEFSILGTRSNANPVPEKGTALGMTETLIDTIGEHIVLLTRYKEDDKQTVWIFGITKKANHAPSGG